MPKKGKGKKKGGKEGGPPPPKVKVEEEEPLNELSRQFYVIQIKDLEERMGRTQGRCAALQASNEELRKKLKQQEDEQDDLIRHLKITMKERADQSMELMDKLAALTQAKQREKEKFEAHLSRQQEESRRVQEKLVTENSELQSKLESLTSFQENKAHLEEATKKMGQEIERLKEEHKETIYSLEKRSVLDKDRIKKEMVSKVNSVAAEFRKVSDLQMVETTKRTIRENVSISQQLGRMSEKTMVLLRENEALRMKEKEMARHLELIETSEREMTRKKISNQKAMTMLRDKVLAQEQQLQQLQVRSDLCQQLEREARQATELGVTANQESKTHQIRAQLLEQELQSVSAELTEANHEMRRLTDILIHSSRAIQNTLQRVGSESEHVSQREGLMATLLKILNTATHAAQTTPTHQYTPGDLGLVPSLVTTAKGHPPHSTHLPPPPPPPRKGSPPSLHTPARPNFSCGKNS